MSDVEPYLGSILTVLDAGADRESTEGVESPMAGTLQYARAALARWLLAARLRIEG